MGSVTGDRLRTSCQHHYGQWRQPAAFVADRSAEYNRRSCLRSGLPIEILADEDFAGTVHQRLRRDRESADSVATRWQPGTQRGDFAVDRIRGHAVFEAN